MDVAASDGFFLNLSSVMLRLCAPFVEPGGGAFWQRVDASYLQHGRLSFREARGARVRAPVLPGLRVWAGRGPLACSLRVP
jgi:hypothetical protein